MHNDIKQKVLGPYDDDNTNTFPLDLYGLDEKYRNYYIHITCESSLVNIRTLGIVEGKSLEGRRLKLKLIGSRGDEEEKEEEEEKK